MREHVRLDHVELVALVGIDTVQFAKELRIAGVGAIHELDLEAPLVVGVLRIERLVRGQQQLVELNLVGVVGEQLAEVEAIGGTGWIAHSPPSICADRWMPLIHSPGGGASVVAGAAAGEAGCCAKAMAGTRRAGRAWRRALHAPTGGGLAR